MLKKISSNKIINEIISLIILLLVILAFKSSFFGNYTVPTGSMEPTILPGDKLVANMIAYNVRVPFTNIVLWEHTTPEVGDIVVFDNPRDRNISFVKRLIGKPGDKVTVQDGIIKVNGLQFKTTPDDIRQIREIIAQGGHYEESNGLFSYTVQRKSHFPDFEEQEWKIPKDHYFMMGDNRDRSSDSREWGFLSKNHIKGKASLIYFSMDWPNYSQMPRFRLDRIGTILK